MTSDATTLRLLAGSGRSGTTWLLDVLCEANDLHPVFEPLHPQGWSRAASLTRRYAGLPAYPPRPEENLDALPAFVDAVLAGRYPRTWIDYRVRPDRLRPTAGSFSDLSSIKRFVAHWRKLWRHRRRYRRQPGLPSLVKLIRGNLLLPALGARPHTHWALVIRHPAAVVESQIRLKGDWDAARIAARYEVDERLEARMGKPWRHWATRMRTEAEMFTLIWCLENLLPLEDLAESTERFVFYEHLAQQDDASWRGLLNALGLDNRPGDALLQRPSQQSSVTLGQRVVSTPLERLSKQDAAGIQRVLELFDVSFYDIGSLTPKPEALTASKPWRTT
ncbi:MAG: hypothetical protein AAF465_07990 [Pseudomonadota bacterium]